ncbi:MAG: flagellar hook-basal body complex protein FliE [Bacillota bacterium]|nr:flagellar hook-basal body complex protein FliE [Bacillota bacterium]
MAVNSVSGFNAISPIGIGKNDPKTNDQGLNFADMLNNALNNVNDLQLQSEQLGDDLATGKTDNIHEVLIATEKADISLQLTMQIRNKLMDAYSEIMRMQI